MKCIIKTPDAEISWTDLTSESAFLQDNSVMELSLALSVAEARALLPNQPLLAPTLVCVACLMPGI